MGRNRACFEGILVGAAKRRALARHAQPISQRRHLLAAAAGLGRAGRLAGGLASLLGTLDQRGLLRWEETFLDGSFAPAKKGALRSGKPSAARARSGW